MRKLLTVLTDILFPPSPQETLLRKVSLDSIQTFYQPGTFKNIEYLCRYSDPIIKTAVKENKFHHNQLAARILGRVLEEWIMKQTQPTVYIPIPLGKKRLRQRGHNQVETILQCAVTRININNNLLRRNKNTPPQSHLNKVERQKNMQDVFVFTGKTSDLSTYTQVVLVDDVVTTGATIAAARATLAPHLPPGSTITCLALAH